MFILIEVQQYHRSSPESDKDNNDSNNNVEYSLHISLLMRQMYSFFLTEQVFCKLFLKTIQIQGIYKKALSFK